MRKRRTDGPGILVVVACAVAISQAAELENVLCFYSQKDHREQAEKAEAMMQELSQEYGFSLTVSRDSRVFNDAELAKYQVVIVNNCGYWTLGSAQAAAFQRYIRNGGGTVAWHMSGANHNAWAWYQSLVGATNTYHSAITNARVYVEQKNRDHPILEGVSDEFTIRDEWYNYSPDPSNDPSFTILLLVDEKSYTGGTMGTYHPVAWCHEFDGGRSYFHNMSHPLETYDNEDVRRLVINALRWAAGDIGTRLKEERGRPHMASRAACDAATPAEVRYYRLDGSVAPRAAGFGVATRGRDGTALQVYVKTSRRSDSPAAHRTTLSRVVR